MVTRLIVVIILKCVEISNHYVVEQELLHKDRMLEMEAGFSVLLWQSQDIPP